MDHSDDEKRGGAEPATGDPAETTPDATDALRREVVSALKSVYDPEIPVDIWELGLIYDIGIDDDANVRIEMTLTSPACPVAGSLPGEVEGNIRAIDGVSEVVVELVWEPPWSMERMSESAKLQLGFM